jgi:hypothetical protein
MASNTISTGIKVSVTHQMMPSRAAIRNGVIVAQVLCCFDTIQIRDRRTITIKSLFKLGHEAARPIKSCPEGMAASVHGRGACRRCHWLPFLRASSQCTGPMISSRPNSARASGRNRAGGGQPAAAKSLPAPPSNVMNSRRFIGSPRGRPGCLKSGWVRSAHSAPQEISFMKMNGTR